MYIIPHFIDPDGPESEEVDLWQPDEWRPRLKGER